MNIVSIIAAFALQTGSTQAPPAPLELPNGVTVVEDHIGDGKLLEEGDKITIQYQVRDSLNRELANSTKRGLPYTLIVGTRNSDRLVSVALAGMHAGGMRTALVPADLIPQGIGSIVPPKTDLHLWIYVIAAKAFNPPKVESLHAERTQGTVEVPRTIAHNGSTRT